MESEVRKKILDAFTAHGEEFVSGQYLADLIGCSRTAVWKHMDELRKEGFELEAVRKKGYRIVKKPEKVSPDEIRLGLKSKVIGQSIHYYESIDSTQQVAKQLSLSHAKEGTVVIAEEQTKGRGRLSREWHSPLNSGIWLSLIVRPNIPIMNTPQLTLLTAVAVVQAIRKVVHVSAYIKWPNDILIHGKKIAGILTELQAEADKVEAVIIGIGINCNQSKDDFPDELKEIATSLKIESGEMIDRAKIIQELFYTFENLYHLYLKEGFSPIKLLWTEYTNTLGKTITARTLKGTITGKALGITDMGVLELEDEMGNIHQIYSADIEE